MSDTKMLGLAEFSHALEYLVETAARGVVAVRAAGYRVVSGVCLAEDLIALPEHELKRKDKVPVVLRDGTEVSATVLGRDQSVDIAVLKTEAGVLNPLPTANPETIRAGMLAAVVG